MLKFPNWSIRIGCIVTHNFWIMKTFARRKGIVNVCFFAHFACLWSLFVSFVFTFKKSGLVRINRPDCRRKNKTWTDRCCGNRKLLEGPSTSGSCWRRHHRSSQPTTQPRSTQDKISSFLRRSLNFISNPQYLQTLYPSMCQGLKRCRQQLLKHCLLRNWNSYETNKVLLHSCRK